VRIRSVERPGPAVSCGRYEWGWLIDSLPIEAGSPKREKLLFCELLWRFGCEANDVWIRRANTPGLSA